MSRDGLTNDERMNVVCTLVGEDRLQVVRVAADRIFQGNSIGTKNSSCFTRSFERLSDIVALGNRNLYWVQQALVFEPSELEGEQLCFDEFSCHDRQFLLDKLEASDRTIELDTRFGIVQCYLVTGPSSTYCTPGNAVAGFIEAREWTTHTTDIGQHVLGRHTTILKVQLRGDRGSQREFVMHVTGSKSWRATLYDEATHTLLRLCPDDCYIRNAAVGNPHLRAV